MPAPAACRLQLALLASATWGAVTGSAPHVVLLVLDDVGWADVGYHGGNFPTPNIDNLAGSGVKLERMYVMPVCSPTRAAIQTGRYSFRTGMQHWTTLVPGGAAGIPSTQPTVAETFKAAGYSTNMIGKWHLGSARWSQTPTGRGYDSHYGYLQGQVDYYNRTIASSNLYPLNKLVHSKFGADGAAYDFWDGRRAVYEHFGEYTVDAYESRLDKLLSPYGSSHPPTKPLFLYYAEQQLHIPLEAPPESRHLEACQGVVGGSTEVNRTVLCSMASRLDQNVGHLVALLKRYSLWDNTLIFATADNGGMTQWSNSWPGSASSNWPLRGGKTTLFEGGVRAVSFVAGGALPSKARNTTSRQLLHAVDILPTLASFASVPLLAQSDGIDAWLAITGGAAATNRTEVPLNIGVNPLGGIPWWISGAPNNHALNYSALISWPWKVVVGTPFVGLGTSEPRRRDGWWSVEGYRYTAPKEEKDLPHRLYNLEVDEEERYNLADRPEHQELLKQLIGRVQWYGSKESGWVPPQTNLPLRRGNPLFHNWTWAPFLRGGDDAMPEDVDIHVAEEVLI
eukprot:TRINITY_DN43973_c0_g1_i1.p1 TRINITY_DN43973_c0_g1~~TRINITY_DN43973_c0_g1_i1.p1  ORF type:complete len:602 (+),score=114.35 TRINITY_DN43973_c0_g1_i1:109-1806(+)